MYFFRPTKHTFDKLNKSSTVEEGTIERAKVVCVQRFYSTHLNFPVLSVMPHPNWSSQTQWPWQSTYTYIYTLYFLQSSRALITHISSSDPIANKTLENHVLLRPNTTSILTFIDLGFHGRLHNAFPLYGYSTSASTSSQLPYHLGPLLVQTLHAYLRLRHG